MRKISSVVTGLPFSMKYTGKGCVRLHLNEELKEVRKPGIHTQGKNIPNTGKNKSKWSKGWTSLAFFEEKRGDQCGYEEKSRRRDQKGNLG